MKRDLNRPAGDQLLRATAEKFPPSMFQDYREWLRQLHSTMKLALSGKFSWLEFSRLVGLSRTNVLHQIVQGERPLSPRSAQKIAKLMELPDAERNFLMLLVEWQDPHARQVRNGKYRDERKNELLKKVLSERKASNSENSRARIEYFSAWYHPVIREMARLPDFPSDPRALAERLVPRIRPEQARASLELLVKLGFLKRDPQTGAIAGGEDETISTGDEIDSMTESLALVRYHASAITLGSSAMTQVDETQRDIGAITVAVSRDTMREMKREVQRLRKRLLELAARDNSPEGVWQFNAQLFPVTENSDAGDSDEDRDTRRGAQEKKARNRKDSAS